MDVKTKMKLMLVVDNYWDMLPPEMQELIFAYKIGQEYIDEKRKQLMRDLCHEIKKYRELKRKWEIGHVRCIVKKDMCFLCYCHHLKIIGCFEDEEKIPRERFLGFGFEEALRLGDGVKSSFSS